MKRDYLEEIESKKERAKNNQRQSILIHRMEALDAVVEHCQKVIDVSGLQSDLFFKQNNELHRYISIGTIACVESFFRAVVKELIDFGSPFSDKAASLREIKFDFSIVQAIAGKRLTVGDFLSHLLPLKSFEDINSIMTIRIGKEFLHELKSYFFEADSTDEEEYRKFFTSDELSDEMIKQIAEIYDGVKETFKLRNIFCHEAAETDFFELSVIYKGYDSIGSFLNAANELVWELVEPNRPTCNADLSWKLHNDSERLKRELASLVNRITAVDSLGEIVFQTAWEAYRDERVQIISSLWDGGSGQGIAMLSEEIHLTKNRIAELNEEIRNGFY